MAVDEKGAGLADTELGDVVADRQPGVAAEEAVKAGLAQRRHVGELGDRDPARDNGAWR